MSDPRDSPWGVCKTLGLFTVAHTPRAHNTHAKIMKVTALARALFVALLASVARSAPILTDAESCEIYSRVVELNCGIHENQQDCVGSSCEWDSSDYTCGHPSAEMSPFSQDSAAAYYALYNLESDACTPACSDARCTPGRDLSGADACVLTLDATENVLISVGAPNAIFAQHHLTAYSNVMRSIVPFDLRSRERVHVDTKRVHHFLRVQRRDVRQKMQPARRLPPHGGARTVSTTLQRHTPSR